MTRPPSVPVPRKVLAVALGAVLLSGAAPGAAVAGGHAKGQPKCDPATQVCDTGRKNG